MLLVYFEVPRVARKCRLKLVSSPLVLPDLTAAIAFVSVLVLPGLGILANLSRVSQALSSGSSRCLGGGVLGCPGSTGLRPRSQPGASPFDASVLALAVAFTAQGAAR